MSNESKNPISKLVLAKTYRESMGVSDTTLWRWVKKGWLSSVNISGRVYITLASIKKFEEDSLSGMFAKEPSGAAGESSKIKASSSTC
jgi:hypothetical protein